MTFYDKLAQAQHSNNSLVCIGLDPSPDKLPLAIAGDHKPLFSFNRAIIDASASYVCAYKPQFAYYAAAGAEDQLRDTIAYIHDVAPEIPVILDVKRNDIGSTAEQYAKEAFDRYGADALTVNPYMGGDSIKPFLDRADKGVIVLCRTSNPGAGDFQDLQIGDRKLFEIVAEKAAVEWNGNRNVMLVVGATWPNELARIRRIVGDMPLLTPGIGAQGGDLAAVMQHGRGTRGDALVINSSRGIIYAGKDAHFARAAGEAARALRDQINRFRT
jgi:orotidine-5'-phosphate decarboxylase